MMPPWLMMLLGLLSEAWSTWRDARIQFLKVQVEMLRARVSGVRVILPPEDRRRLLQLGVAIDHHVDDLIGIVSVKTDQSWLREQRAGKEPGRVGRPRKITASVRALMAIPTGAAGIRRKPGI